MKRTSDTLYSCGTFVPSLFLIFLSHRYSILWINDELSTCRFFMEYFVLHFLPNYKIISKWLLEPEAYIAAYRPIRPMLVPDGWYILGHKCRRMNVRVDPQNTKVYLVRKFHYVKIAAGNIFRKRLRCRPTNINASTALAPGKKCSGLPGKAKIPPSHKCSHAHPNSTVCKFVGFWRGLADVNRGN